MSNTLLPQHKAKYHLDNHTNKTGFIGITFKKRDCMYQARIRVPGLKEKVYCGSSKSAEEAARMYDAKSRELFGPSAITNFEL